MIKGILTTYYIGLNDKDLHKQLIDTHKAIEIIREVCLIDTCSLTLDICSGIYKGETETTLKLELINDELSSKTLETLKEILNQECILKTKTKIEYDLV